ncbi:sucrose transporter, putative, partial [Entamoeba invadens IP1]
VMTTIKNVLQMIWESLKGMNKYMYIILVVVFTGWAAWTPLNQGFQILTNNYFFANPTDAFFFYNLGRLLFAVAMSFSALFFAILNRVPEITLCASNVLSFAWTLLLAVDARVFTEASPYICCLFLLVAPMYSQLISLPYAFVRNVVKTDDFGFFVGVVNTAITLAQLFSNIPILAIQIVSEASSAFVCSNGNTQSSASVRADSLSSNSTENFGDELRWFTFGYGFFFLLSGSVALLLKKVSSATKINERVSQPVFEENLDEHKLLLE